VNLNVLAVARPNHAFGALKKRAEVFEERRVADIDVQGRGCAPRWPQRVANLTLVAKDRVSRPLLVQSVAAGAAGQSERNRV
jgi:hypothetical protein